MFRHLQIFQFLQRSKSIFPNFNNRVLCHISVTNTPQNERVKTISQTYIATKYQINSHTYNFSKLGNFSNVVFSTRVILLLLRSLKKVKEIISNRFPSTITVYIFLKNSSTNTTYRTYRILSF